MTTINVRGLSKELLSKLKQQARSEGSSLSRLVVRLLQDHAGTEPTTSFGARRFVDLDALADTWNAQQVDAFERAIVPFSQVDPLLWK
jgi:hypothetical protein